MRMKANRNLLSAASIEQMKNNYFNYLDRAIQDARSFTPGAMGMGLGLLFEGQPPPVHRVGLWFGDLAQDQLGTLIAGLTHLRRCCEDYTVNGRRHERLVEWCIVSGDLLHSPNQFAASYTFGVPDPNKHFDLRVYSGLLLNRQHYDWQVNILYHELSHRVLSTQDVTHAATNNQPAYGQARVQALSAADPASALNNASNWGYYITACNGLTQWPE